MSEKIYNVLFLCTRNSARSIMAEAILNHVGKGRFRGFSAGSQPANQVDALAIEQIRRANLAVEGLHCKHWNVFASSEAPQMDFVFAVCNDLPQNDCPVWLGQPITANWGIDNPVSVEGSEEERRQAFSNAFTQINWRISIFTHLHLSKLSAIALKNELETISRLYERRKSPRPVSLFTPR